MSQQQTDDQSGLIMYLSRQSLPIRLLAFFVFIIGIVGLIVAITGGLYYANVSNFPRLIPIAVAEDVSVEQFTIFTDEEAYPSALASAEDGTLYTGSFAHGTVWRINPAGTIGELPNTRQEIGSVIGLDIASDGTLYILDRLDPLENIGAKVWQLSPEGTLTLIYESAMSDITVTNPNDIAVDANGRVYLLDVSSQTILTIEGETVSSWWTASDDLTIITGLAYDSVDNALILADAGTSSIYRVPIASENPQAETRTLFTILNNDTDIPFFNGVDIAPDGTVYVASLDANEIWRIDDAESYTILSGNYRGSSDVAYDMTNNRLYINNWDQSWIIPITFVVIQFDVKPRLPFSVDVINLDVEASQP